MLQGRPMIQKRPMEWDMDGSLEEGTAVAFAEDGIRHQILRIPYERPPEWAKKVTLSPEDYGKLVRHMSGR